MNQSQNLKKRPQKEIPSQQPPPAPGSTDNDTNPPPPKKKKQGRRKIKIEFIEDKSRRQITFSKRKAGIMKKAYELTTLTGTQALLLIASETGHVYTFATPKLQPFVTRQDGKALIQRCLNSPDYGLVDDPNYAPPTPSTPSSGPPVPVNNQSADDGVPQIPAFVESSLVIMVGKMIPVVPNGFTANHFKDLNGLAMRWAHQLGLDIICLAGGYPSFTNELFRSQNDRITSEVVVGIKVAEVDYTSPNQPYFSLEKLHNFLNSAKMITDDFWREISSRPYVLDTTSENNNQKGPGWGKQQPPPQPGMEYYNKADLLQTPNSLFVVSTYPNAFVNVVFGVRKQGVNGKGSQVVGISCHQSASHVCKLDIDERTHFQRVNLMEGVEGAPYYHLLPELFK